MIEFHVGNSERYAVTMRPEYAPLHREKAYSLRLAITALRLAARPRAPGGPRAEGAWMMGGHTPGPWSAVLDDDPRGQPVPYYRGLVALVSMTPGNCVSVVSDGRTVSPDEWKANAVLLASAPALLAVAEMVLALADDRTPPELLAAATAAIAEARPTATPAKAGGR